MSALHAGRARAPRAAFRLVSALAVILCSGACSSEPGTAAKVSYNTETGRLALIEADTNGNGVADTWSHMDGARAIRIDVDKDEDGTIERWEYYTGEPGAQRLEKVGFSTRSDGIVDAWVFEGGGGQVGRIEYARHRDGQVTRTEYYEGGQLVRAEEDSRPDGRPDGLIDKWETFRNGVLASVAIDADRDGIPDRRLVYGDDGALERFDRVP